MEDLVLIKKNTRNEILKNARMGRPARTTFSLRHYADTTLLAIPPGFVQPGDNVDFYMSKTGFAIDIGPLCERAISGRKGTSTVSAPKELHDALTGIPVGSRDVSYITLDDGKLFFPFITISKS